MFILKGVDKKIQQVSLKINIFLQLILIGQKNTIKVLLVLNKYIYLYVWG